MKERSKRILEALLVGFTVGVTAAIVGKLAENYVFGEIQEYRYEVRDDPYDIQRGELLR